MLKSSPKSFRSKASITLTFIKVFASKLRRKIQSREKNNIFQLNNVFIGIITIQILRVTESCNIWIDLEINHRIDLLTISSNLHFFVTKCWTLSRCLISTKSLLMQLFPSSQRLCNLIRLSKAAPLNCLILFLSALIENKSLNFS